MCLDRVALREAITGPLVRARELALKDIREHDELLDGSHHCSRTACMCLCVSALREAITGPLVRATELAMKDIREHDELLDGSQDHAPRIFLASRPGPDGVVSHSGVRRTSSSRLHSRQVSRQSSTAAAAAAAATAAAAAAAAAGPVRQEPRFHTGYDRLE
uniref:Uncharacterized protein n=1 Tax=Tetradesmus obliquus TaxID=3088 RepID=A0A383VT30_TETOB